VIRSIAIFTTALAAPGLPDLMADDDSGASSTDNQTTDTSPRITVALSAGAGRAAVVGDTLSLIDAAGIVLASRALQAGDITAGSYTFELSNLSDGLYTLNARLSDNWGNAVLNAASGGTRRTRPGRRPRQRHQQYRQPHPRVAARLQRQPERHQFQRQRSGCWRHDPAL
jgi:hypothetical protein